VKDIHKGFSACSALHRSVIYLASAKTKLLSLWSTRRDWRKYIN
jgi:hypothetical protein